MKCQTVVKTIIIPLVFCTSTESGLLLPSVIEFSVVRVLKSAE